MDRISVQSSNLKSVGYDTTTQELEIEFKNGGIYRFKRVPSDVCYNLLNASSKGNYFANNIKGKYDFEIVRHPD